MFAHRTLLLALALFACACVGGATWLGVSNDSGRDRHPPTPTDDASRAQPAKESKLDEQLDEPSQRRRSAAAHHHTAQRKIAEVQRLSGAAPLRAELGARFDQGVRIEAAGTTVVAVPIGTARSARSDSGRGTVTYLDAWPGVDVVQEPGASWLKESMIVRRHSASARNFTFELRGRPTPALTAAGEVVFRDGATPIALRIPAPRAVDATGTLLPKSATTFQLSGRRLTLRAAIPAGTPYPVTVDPTFAIGQGADHVIGQSGFDNAPARHGRDSYSMYNPMALATDGTKLMYADYSRGTNGSISIYNSFPSTDAAVQDAGWPGSSTYSYGLWTNGTKSIVADTFSNRVYLHNAFNGTANLVLGQTTSDGYQPNVGGRSASTLNNPYGVWSDGTRIAVADHLNNRVLIWNTWPTTNGQPADIVLGQADMTSGDVNRGGSVAADTLYSPRGAYFDGSRFYVADSNNHRVLIWNSFPTSTGQVPNEVLGQSAMNRRTCNDAALTSKQRMCGPVSVNGDGTNMAVADYSNHRVLLWSSPPSTTSQAANRHIGDGNVAAPTRTSLRNPVDAIFVTGKLVVSEMYNNRLLLWGSFPATDAAPADNVLGQIDFTSSGAMGNRGDSWYDISGIEYDAAGRLWVGHLHEQFMSRFPATLPAIGAVADYSTGNATPGNAFYGGAADRYSSWAISDARVADDGTFLLSQNSNTSRVTWSTSTPSTNPPPLWDAAVGQPTTSHIGINRDGAPAANTLAGPQSADWDGTHFAIADTQNNRVLIWNNKPATNEAADVVLGQPNFTTTSPNTGGVSANSLSSPMGVRLRDGRLYVADTVNNRVLIWNEVPSSNHAAADVVLGQASMFTSNNATTASSLWRPLEVDVDEGLVAVADSYNRRVLLWDSAPQSSGRPADRVIGKVDMTSNNCSRLRATLCYPVSIALRDGKLAVNDNNERIVVYDDVAAPTVTGVAAVVAGERATVSWTTDEDASSELVWDTAPHALPNEYTHSSNPGGRRRAHSVSAEPLTSGTVYYYRVVSVDARGNTTVSSEGTFTASNVTDLRASNGFASDATIDETQVNRNYGGSDELVIGGGPGARERALVRFDLDQLPANATILSATLTLHQTDAGSATTPTARARVLDAEWDEGGGNGTVEPSGVTWNSTDGVDPWTTPGSDIGAIVASGTLPAAPGPFDLDVAGQVADWVSGATPNAGVAVHLDPEATGETRRFASSEHSDPDLRPRLVIEWSGRDVAQPRVANVRTQAISSSSVRVTWDTDEPTSSVLEYGPTVAYGDQLADPVATNSHELILDDLQPSTTYHVRVSATDAQGNLTRSSDVVFRTSYRVRIVASDALLREDKPARNHGGQSVLLAGNMNGTWQRTRSALHFDTSVLPPDARIRSATANLVVARQASTATPQMHVAPVDQDFVQGTSNPVTGPGWTVAGVAPAAPAPLHSSAERHTLLTSSGWWQITPQPNVWDSTLMSHRRSSDGFGFSDDAFFGTRGWGNTGTALTPDGSSAWSIGFNDETSRVKVTSYNSASDAETSVGELTLPAGVAYLPSIAVASDGYLWIKGESMSGQVWVARSAAPRNPSAWDTPVQLATQAAPAHATLVALSGGRVLLISQDGGQLSSREWNGSSWGAAIPIAADAETPSPWLTRTSFAVVDDGSGGAVVAYVVAGGGVKSASYAAGSWAAPQVVSISGTAVALTRDLNGDVPMVFWQDGVNLRSSRLIGTWTAPVVVPAALPATPTQIAVSAPSDEAVGVTWTVDYTTWFEVRWYGVTLDKAANGATWNTTDGSAPWSAPGGDSGAPALATPTAPGAVGGVMSFDLTSATTDWHDGTTPNHGMLLRATTENPALNDWKAFYSSEAVNPSVRPVLTVDYDLATATVTQPTSATAWQSSTRKEIKWQVTGSGMTQVEIRYSSDGGATWPNLVEASAPNTGSYEWTTPPAEGSYRVQVQAKNALGDVVTIGESDPFVIDDTPPDAIDDLAAPSPRSTAALTWSVPADYGGGGMANATYRVYRSTSAGVLGTRIATVPTAFHEDASAVADGTYHYTVIPVDTAGNAQLVGNDQIAVVRDASQPNAVTDLLAPSLTNTSIPLTWSAVSDVGVAGMGTYRVYRSSTAGVLGTQIALGMPPGTTDTPPSDGTWYYTIVPVDLAGNARNAGNNQAAVTYDTLAPTSPSVLLDGGAASTATGAVTAALAATGASEYQISEDPTFAAASWVAVAASTPFALTGEGIHTVHVRYRDAAGNVGSGVSDAIRFDTTPPNPDPMTGAGAALSTTQITWTATTATDASGLHATPYSVDDGAPVWQASRTFVEGGLSPNTQYTRTVRARDILGHTSIGPVQAYTHANPPANGSAAPRNWALTGYRILLAWDAPAGGAASYNVRSSADGYASVLLNASATTQTITGLAANTSYTYKVCSVNTAGVEEPTCTPPLTATTALAPPASATTSDITATTATFDWPDVATATGYQVYLYSDGSCSVPVGSAATVASSTWNATGLDPDFHYRYHVRTINAAGVAGGPTTCLELTSTSRRTALAVSVDSSAHDFGDRLPGEIIDGEIDLDVETYASDGYSVLASIDQLPTNGTDSVPATTSGSIAAPGPWAGDGFGFTVASAANLDPKWSNGAAFAAPPLVPTTLHATGVTLTPDVVQTTRTTIGYRIVLPPTQGEGTYTTTVILTAVPLA